MQYVHCVRLALLANLHPSSAAVRQTTFVECSVLGTRFAFRLSDCARILHVNQFSVLLPNFAECCLCVLDRQVLILYQTGGIIFFRQILEGIS